MSTGWYLAAPLYKLTIPNDPRLGWTPYRIDVFQVSVVFLCLLFWTGAAIMRIHAQWEVYLVIASVVVASSAWFFFVRKKRKTHFQCASLSDSEVLDHALAVQRSALASEINTDPVHERVSDLGGQLLAPWIVTCAICGYTAAAVFTPQFVGTKVLSLVIPIAMIYARQRAGNLWVTKFVKRIKSRHCVGCGYNSGGPLEVVTVCPECGVILPLHYRTGPDPNSGPPFAESPSR